MRQKLSSPTLLFPSYKYSIQMMKPVLHTQKNYHSPGVNSSQGSDEDAIHLL